MQIRLRRSHSRTLITKLMGKIIATHPISMKGVLKTFLKWDISDILSFIFVFSIQFTVNKLS